VVKHRFDARCPPFVLIARLSCGSLLTLFLWMFGVFIPKARRRIAGDRLAMAKPGSIE